MKHYLFSVVLLLCSLTATQAQTTRYVAPTAAGSGNGSSWANASSNLQGMINASASGDAVWVKAGTYKPTQDPFGSTSPTYPQDKTFYVKDGVKIYGGFAGVETALSQRNISTNVTILSGDFNGDDIVTGSGATLAFTNNSENAYHVVLASGTATGVGVTIDGFTIKGGYANIPSGGTTPTVNGNSISRTSGAGIYLFSKTNSTTNNTIANNTITNNAINSISSGGGGGIYAAGGTITISNNLILKNNTAYRGGGIYAVANTGTITISGNTILGNNFNTSGIGIGGGGISMNNSSGSFLVSNNIIS